MCATTDLPTTGASATAAAPKVDAALSAQSRSQSSSYLTPISIKQQIDTSASEDAPFHHESSDASLGARVRQSHHRRPSVVHSDFGVEDDNDNCSNDSDRIADQNFCAQVVSFQSAVCQVDQLDIFMACRHPLEILGMHPTEGEAQVATQQEQQQHAHSPPGSCNKNSEQENCCQSNNRVSGYHAIPTNCEYCGSPDIAHCDKGCQRPKSFFPKQRPPFSPKGDGSEWDEQDFCITLVNNNSIGVGGRSHENNYSNNGAYARADKHY
jgi:hypothetical protein